jgi:PKD repeat protein
MRKINLVLAIIVFSLFAQMLRAQDFSNKGKDFWLAYPGHIDGNNSRMALYISATTNTSGVVTYASSTIPFTVTANQATVVQITGAANVGSVINAQNEGIANGKGIHITSLEPIVVYAHILNAARSGSTLVLPTNTLGKEYVASSYKSTSNSTSSNTNSSPSGSQFTVVAVENNTTVEITPSAADVANTRTVGTPFTVALNQGDVYQYRTSFSEDITGTKIRTLAGPNGGCKRIAVFSGSSWTAMNCNNSSGGDNLFQQQLPKTAWGREYVTAPFADRQFDIFRIIVSDPTAVVTLNGSIIPVGTLINNSYYEFSSSVANSISSDKAIMVVQYMISQTCDTRNPTGCGNTSNPCPWQGDPEMIILNSTEQFLNDVTVISARNNLTPPNTNINKHFFTIIMKSIATSSLRIDGNVPTGTFFSIGSSGYSYLHENVTASTLTNPSHRINADSGFIALAYGMGNVESYGYNAGTNVRDLSQQVGFSFPNALEVSSTGCKGSEFKYKVAFPATLNVTQMVWDFMGAPMLPNNTTVNVSSPTIDSSTVVNGKLLNWFSLPTLYTYTTAGNYFLKITITISNADNCGNEQEYEFPITITDPPVATFSFPPIQCVGETIQFTETTPQTPKPTYKFWWSFDDAATGANNNSTLRNPTHLFSAPGNYTVRFHNITTPGCLSDTTDQQITVPDFPRASIASDVPTVCMDGASPRITFTGTDGIPEYEFSYTIDNGTGPGPVQTITSTGGTASLNVPTNVAGTFRYNLISVKNVGSNICTRSYNNVFAEVVVNANTGLALTNGSPNQTVCQNTAITDIVYTISGGGTNATIIGPALPTGLTGMYNNVTKTFTISGTPTGAPGTYPFTVEATGPCLPNTLTGAITINELPSAAISNSVAEVCLNAPSPTVTLTGSGGTAPYTFTYRLNGTLQPAVTSSGNTYIINVPTNATGTFLYELVNITDASSTACAQAQSGSTTVIVNPLPTASFTTVAPYCTTRPISFTNTSVPNAGNITTWVWNFGDASAPVTINAPANPNAQHIFTTANTYNVTLTATTDKGCVSTNPAVPITITNRPKPGFIIPEVCINDVASIFTDTSRVDGGETFDAAGYLWTFGDPGSGAANTATTMHGSHLYTAIGPYNVMHAVTTTAGCKDTAYGTIFINAADPVSDFNIVTPTTLCANDTVSLVNRSTISQGTVTKLEIYWDALGAPTTFETVDVPVFNGVYKHKYPTLTTTQTYRIRMVAYSGSICLADKIDNITVNAAPRVQFLAMNNVCFDAAPFQISQASELGGVVGTPTYSGPGVSSSGIFNPSLVVPGIPHTLSLIHI